MLSTFKISGQANSSPTEIVNSFYNSYLTCVNKHFQSQSTKSAKEDCPFNSYSALSPDLIAKLNVPGFADPVLCAQNTPTSISVDTATINDNTATTTVHELFTGSGDNPIEIALSNQNSNWLITTITCAKP
jgi:predicted aspartyl protease